ncbi:cAMP-dependent protein kinase inhibitor alpha isoform X1 [Chiloscyllium plagiosum]|uniref:cAMP-dependent protein kinase inhibitor alpha isoform X1 n=1 Tax=Chiloscyllium plagiosum TaxID=36176 RepID=UPI001CB8220E|nr:cAMP-dependent protein kinase inhibitor alpha isoform X1 [Chiloscyllium plagiosum]
MQLTFRSTKYPEWFKPYARFNLSIKRQVDSSKLWESRSVQFSLLTLGEPCCGVGNLLTEELNIKVRTFCFRYTIHWVSHFWISQDSISHLLHPVCNSLSGAEVLAGIGWEGDADKETQASTNQPSGSQEAQEKGES